MARDAVICRRSSEGWIVCFRIVLLRFGLPNIKLLESSTINHSTGDSVTNQHRLTIDSAMKNVYFTSGTRRTPSHPHHGTGATCNRSHPINNSDLNDTWIHYTRPRWKVDCIRIISQTYPRRLCANTLISYCVRLVRVFFPYHHPSRCVHIMLAVIPC